MSQVILRARGRRMPRTRAGDVSSALSPRSARATHAARALEARPHGANIATSTRSLPFKQTSAQLHARIDIARTAYLIAMQNICSPPLLFLLVD
jgi:hypothetical protein